MGRSTDDDEGLRSATWGDATHICTMACVASFLRGRSIFGRDSAPRAKTTHTLFFPYITTGLIPFCARLCHMRAARVYVHIVYVLQYLPSGISITRRARFCVHCHCQRATQSYPLFIYANNISLNKKITYFLYLRLGNVLFIKKSNFLYIYKILLYHFIPKNTQITMSKGKYP